MGDNNDEVGLTDVVVAQPTAADQNELVIQLMQQITEIKIEMQRMQDLRNPISAFNPSGDDTATRREYSRRNMGEIVEREDLPQVPFDPLAEQCGKKHKNKCLAGTDACFGCGKIDHKIRDYPSVAKNKGENHRRAQPNPSSDSSGSQKQNKFYTLQTRRGQEGSLNVVTSM
ncbi:uncharacterized protein LOC125828978 [Solanum verrucosum]|uniref:uncharacterized protein LOC125828978 n=1 Tax=Solanum verrucosum TaxID=315347 RepID=UPI0020D143A0|nr:uncharacterized protein LOC125828978 [Solanum verrucosum]